MNGLRRRIISILVLSVVFGLFLVQPGYVASTTSPSRITEVIPINVRENWIVSEKDITIDVTGFAEVTASGDAQISISIRYSECECNSKQVSLEEHSVTVTLPEFTKYRELVAAYKRGEIALPIPATENQATTNKVYTGPKYYWYGIKFVAPGDPVQYIDFDHPDNYDTYYPGQWNTPWIKTSVQSGWKKWVHHYASSVMQQSITLGTLFYVAAGLAAAIGGAATVILGVILAALAAIGFAITAFLLVVMQSEQLDGWAYTHDNLYNHNRLISFGLWRDWGWYLGQW